MGWDPETTSGDALAADCRTEVIELHRFFTWWLRGEVPNTDAAFSLVPDALGEDFVLVAPGGGTQERAALLSWLRGAHGSRAGAVRDFRIWIRNYRCRRLGPDHALACYEEWQALDGAERGRLSTAVFRRAADRPNGVVWEHVHETWIGPTP